MRKTVIIGRGEQGRIIENILHSRGGIEITGFLDDRSDDPSCLGKIEDFKKYLKDCLFFIALGDNDLRKKIFTEIAEAGGDFLNAIHKSAVIEDSVEIGRNVFVGALSYINIFSKINDGAYVNSGSVIEHDNSIGDFCHIASGCRTAGGVKIGEGSLIGIGSTVMEDLVIGERTILGAGSNLLANTEPNSIYYGNPARFIKKRP